MSSASLSDSLWIFEIVLGIAVLIAVNFVFVKIIKRIRHKSLSTTPGWKEKMDAIFVMPFHILLWLLGMTLVVEVLSSRFGFSFFNEYLNAFRTSGVVLCLSWVLLRWKAEFQNDFMGKDRSRRKIDAGFIPIVGKMSSIAIWVLTFLIIFQIWGVNIAPLIAFGGIGAAAVAFAAKDVIANFFGGLMLYINRPFTVGDLILLPEHHIEGNIEEMGLYLTCIRDKEKRPIYLPNAAFSHTYVINASRMTHRRIEEKFPLHHADFSKIKVAMDKLHDVIASHPDIDAHLPVLVVLHAFTQNHIELYIDCYTLQTRYEKYLAAKQDILTLLYETLQKDDIKISPPVMSISLKQAVPVESAAPDALV